MSKKPTTKATFRRTPARPFAAKPTAPEAAPEVIVETPEVIEPEAELPPVVEEAAPVETPVAEDTVIEETVIEATPEPVEEAPVAEAPAVEAPAETPVAEVAEPDIAPEVAPEVAEVAIEAPVEAPVAKKPARKPAAKAEAAPVSPAPLSEVEAPTVEVSAPTPSPTETATQAPRWPNLFASTPFAKEFTMSTFPSFDFAAPFQTAFSDFQEKAKTAYEKGNSVFGDYSEFAKGNVEAFVESSKILAAGLQELTSAYVSEGRTGFEALTAEVKELAAAKSPTDFLKLQNDLAKKHFDEAVAAASKHSEALIKLANEAVQPLSTRVTLAVEKVKAAA